MISSFYGVMALLTGGMANALTKYPTGQIGANRTIFYRNIMNTVLLSVVLLFALGETTFSFKWILFTIALSFFGYIPMYYFYKAVTVGKIGVVAPVSSTSVVFTIMLALIFLNERLSILQTAAVAVIIVGIILISINLQELKKSQICNVKSGIPYAVIAAIGWGAWYMLAKISARELGPFLAALIVEAFAIPVAYLLIRRNSEDLKIDPKTLKSISWLSLCMVIWSIFYYQGIRIASVSIVATLSSAGTLVTVLYGCLVFKEKITPKQYMAIALILSGVVLLSWR